jgi:polysaccharide export outer membrane protein
MKHMMCAVKNAMAVVQVVALTALTPMTALTAMTAMTALLVVTGSSTTVWAQNGGSAAPQKPSQAAPAPAPTPPAAQKPTAPPIPAPGAPAKPATPTPAEIAAQAAVQPPLPADYVIGSEDVLIIIFWREKDLSSEVTVRPDGRISIPLLQDVEAAGLTPEQLQKKLLTLSQRFVEDANITVVVKQINSRRVYITGQVAKPGPYLLTSPTTVVQLIATAGGLLEYADSKNIVIVRNEKNGPISYRLNYREIAERKNLKQNIPLKPGDTVIVP